MPDIRSMERDVAMSERLVLSFADAIDKSAGGVSEKSAPQIAECLLITLAQLYIQWGFKSSEVERISFHAKERLVDIMKSLFQDNRNQNLKPAAKGLLIIPTSFRE